MHMPFNVIIFGMKLDCFSAWFNFFQVLDFRYCAILHKFIETN